MKKLFLLIVLSLVVVAVSAQRTQVNVSALPDPLPRFLNTNYPGFVIEKANKVVINNREVTYETVITKGTTQETLLFDQNGKFIRKETGSQPILDKSPVNSAQPSNNKNNNTKAVQPALNTKYVGKDEEPPVQKNIPDTITIRK